MLLKSLKNIVVAVLSKKQETSCSKKGSQNVVILGQASLKTLGGSGSANEGRTRFRNFN